MLNTKIGSCTQGEVDLDEAVLVPLTPTSKQIWTRIEILEADEHDRKALKGHTKTTDAGWFNL